MNPFKRTKPQQPVPTPPQVKPEDVQLCGACQKIGAKHPIKNGDFYLGTITFYVCDECLDKRIENQCNQNFRQRREWPNTSVRLPAIESAKIKARGV